MTIYSLDVLLSHLEPVCCSMSTSNCYFLTCIQVSQEAGQGSGIPISWRIFHSLLWSTQPKALSLLTNDQSPTCVVSMKFKVMPCILLFFFTPAVSTCRKRNWNSDLGTDLNLPPVIASTRKQGSSLDQRAGWCISVSAYVCVCLCDCLCMSVWVCWCKCVFMCVFTCHVCVWYAHI